MVEGVTDYAIFMLDPSGTVINWNPGAQRIKGYSRDEIIGQHFSRFYSDEDRERKVPHKAIETAARTGKYEAEGWRVRKDASPASAALLRRNSALERSVTRPRGRILVAPRLEPARLAGLRSPPTRPGGDMGRITVLIATLLTGAALADSATAASNPTRVPESAGGPLVLGKLGPFSGYRMQVAAAARPGHSVAAVEFVRTVRGVTQTTAYTFYARPGERCASGAGSTLPRSTPARPSGASAASR